jgi:hypothetical protein
MLTTIPAAFPFYSPQTQRTLPWIYSISCIRDENQAAYDLSYISCFLQLTVLNTRYTLCDYYKLL